MNHIRKTIALTFALLAAAVFPSCGGSGGGGASGGSQGLALVSFLQAGQDNMAINQFLEWNFSSPIDPASVGPGSIQVRQGNSFGVTATGDFEVVGTVVRFHPRLPSLCGYGDAGFVPNTPYSVTLVGGSEAGALRNLGGRKLNNTASFNFKTLSLSDPDVLDDQIPGAAPVVLDSTPVAGSPAAAVVAGNECIVRFSENIDPCSIRIEETVSMKAYQTGDRNIFNAAPGAEGRETGFSPAEDTAPGNPFDWGGNASVPSLGAIRIPVQVTLQQDFEQTVLRVRPKSGRFPENCLVVLSLTFGISDFGGDPLTPIQIDFTTENLPATEVPLDIEYDATTPIDVAATTADVNSQRSPGRAQSWISYGGDGDNGPAPQNIPSFPVLDPNDDYTISACDTRTNDGDLDDFDPTTNVILHTGSEVQDPTCTNEHDGSSAVVFEFSSFRIRSGITVTIEGENPVIILVNGPVLIEAGGVLNIAGKNGGAGATNCSVGGNPGEGGPGGGDGGDGGFFLSPSAPHAGSGVSGYGAADHGDAPGTGGGEGGVNAQDPPGWGGSGVGGGGGGHSLAGFDGAAQLSGTGGFAWVDSDTQGLGGGVYSTDASGGLYTPAAGSGGGGGGSAGWGTWPNSCTGSGAGGGGGGGGGFVGITSSGNITISGTILANGGRGGNGGAYTYAGGASGGGGSGGAVRLLTPNDIVLSGALITTAGGLPGAPSAGTYAAGGGTTNAPHYANSGGAGATGRIVLEDGDGVISGLPGATLIPAEGQDGFYRAPLDPSRFVSGGTQTTAVTQPIQLGSIIDPAGVSIETILPDDILEGIPEGSDVGVGNASIVVEVQGYQANANSEIVPATATGWYTAGYATYDGNGVHWEPDTAPGGWIPDAGVGIANLNGNAMFVQVRVTFFMPSDAQTEDPGPFVDRLRIRFSADN